MSPKRREGKEFIQDKDTLLQLAETITSGKELAIRQKICRTKAAGSAHGAPWKQTPGKRPKNDSTSVSCKLRAAKDLVAARKAKHKRERIKARKGQVKKVKSEGEPSEEASVGRSDAQSRKKRVSFA